MLQGGKGREEGGQGGLGGFPRGLWLSAPPCKGLTVMGASWARQGPSSPADGRMSSKPSARVRSG